MTGNPRHAYAGVGNRTGTMRPEPRLTASLSMKIKLTALVAPDMVESIHAIASSLDDVSVNVDIYRHPQDAVDLFDRYAEQSDVLLLGGPIAYHLVQDHIRAGDIEFDRPIVHVPYTEIAIYRALFKVIEEIEGRSVPSISIDHPAESDIRECLEELEISMGQTVTWECSANDDLEELIRFHHRLWSEGHCEFAMTSVYLVYQRLLELGVPVYRIAPAKSSIRNSMQRALLEGQSTRHAESQIVIGIIRLADDAASGGAVSEYQLRRRKLALEQVLLDFGERIQALIDWSALNELRFVTTRGQIERGTRHFREMDLMLDVQKAANIGAFFGIGFGSTANEAEIRAREAVAKARSVGTGACFVVETNGNVRGPVGEATQLDYSLRSDDPYRLKVARRAGLSVATINKLIAFVEKSDRHRFTSLELACAFGITLRSARRILTKLEDARFVLAAGEEQPVSRGRPRKVYQLSFDTGAIRP